MFRWTINNVQNPLLRVALFPLSLLVLYLSYKCYLLDCKSISSLVIIAFCSCLLNHVEEEKMYEQKWVSAISVAGFAVVFFGAVCVDLSVVSWTSASSISCRTDLLAMNSLCFHLSGNVVISPSLGKNHCAGYGPLFLSAPYRCPSTASGPRGFRGGSTAPLLSLFLASDCLTVVYLIVDLSVCPTWSSLSFLDIEVNIFQQIWEIFGCHYLKYFVSLLSVPSLDSSCVCFCGAGHSLGGLLDFPLFWNFFFFLERIISIDLSSRSQMLLPNKTWCQAAIVNFSFQLLYFSTPNFHLALFYNFFIFTHILYLVK